MAEKVAFDVAYPPAAEAFADRARRAELACALRLPERTAERMMGEARALVERLPATLAALGQGLFSYRHAQALVDETAGLSTDDTAAVERLALGSAPTQTASRFTRTVRRLRERRDPSTMIERAATALAERGVTIDPAPDGMAYLTAYLGAVDAAAIHERLTQAAIELRNAGDPRTLGIGPIDAATARRITAEAPRIRDGSCRFPMCGIRTHRSDIDHTRDWQHGGPTDHGNLAHLSRGHHTLKHHGGWRVEQKTPGHLTWTSYLGRQYDTLPDTG